MPIRLAPIAVAAALVTPLAWATPAAAESTTLKAVIFEDVKPLYQKTDAGYEGLGVEFWNRSGCRPIAAKSNTAAPTL